MSTQQNSTERSRLSDPTQNDLNSSPYPSTKTPSTNNAFQSSDATTPLSPSKSTPTKSRNKRRNDAKKRSASTKNKMSSHEGQEQGPKQADVRMSQEILGNQPVSPQKNKAQQQNKSKELIRANTVSIEDEVKHEEQSQKDNHQANKLSEETKKVENLDRANSITQFQDSNVTNSLLKKQRLNEQFQLKLAHQQSLIELLTKQHSERIKELEASLVSATRTCDHLEKLLQHELTNRTRLEAENDSLKSTVSKLRNQIRDHEVHKATDKELIRVLNATLMERETEVSILKLKMTRLQTNPSVMLQNRTDASDPKSRADPCKAFKMAGRSNSEFTRNSPARSTMIADSISARSSTSRLQQVGDRDATVWANVPDELTPSKRPLVLERNLPPIYGDYHTIYSEASSVENQSSTPRLGNRQYRTLPRSMKSPPHNVTSSLPSHESKQNETFDAGKVSAGQPNHCLVTNLDESSSTSRSGNRSSEANSNLENESKVDGLNSSIVRELESENDSKNESRTIDVQQKVSVTSSAIQAKASASHKSTTSNTKSSTEIDLESLPSAITNVPGISTRSPSSPVKISSSFKKIFGKFKRSDSTNDSQSKSDLSVIDSPTSKPFERGATRSTLVGPPSSLHTHMSPRKAINFQTDKPFAEWDTNMLVDWLTMIGLSMYANQCKRWVKCGAYIMNATPAEVDKGLGITNHLHRKKLRLAISELNGDCDKITKAAAKLDYLWVARWLDDIGLPQYKEAFINARVDGRVLNYLTIEDLVSMGVKSLLHHSSIRCGIRVLRSINFDLQLLRRRATAEEIERMSSMRQSMDQQVSVNYDKSNDQQTKAPTETEVPLWTCHRVMEWLRMIDFAEFAPNLRGSGLHGGLIIYEDGFNSETMSALLSIPSNRTLLRRHLSTFFQNLIGDELTKRKLQHKELTTSQRLNPSAEIKTPKKSPLWFGRLKSSKVGQDGMDEYLCPMYPVEPQMIKSPTRKSEVDRSESTSLPRIPESVDV